MIILKDILRLQSVCLFFFLFAVSYNILKFLVFLLFSFEFMKKYLCLLLLIIFDSYCIFVIFMDSHS